MTDQPQIPESVSPEQFFEQLLPMGFAAQAEQGDTPAGDFTLQYHVTGAGGGDWQVAISGGQLTSRKGSDEANLTITVAVDDWRDAVMGRNGAALLLIVPQRRPGRPDNSAVARRLKGTVGLELSREGKEPFRSEMCFNNAPTPRTVIKMTISDYIDMQDGKLNGQQAFMSGRLRAEGDMGFLMQTAALNA